MEKDEFKDILNIDFPESKADANRYYEYCINKNKKRKSKMHKSIFMIVYTLLICIISVATTTLFFNLLSNNNQKKPILDYSIEKSDVVISDITTNGFSYHFDKNENVNIESISLFCGDNLVKELDSEIVQELDSDATYKMVIKYYYEVNGEKVLKETIVDVKTIPLPVYEVNPYDDRALFIFQKPEIIVDLVINDAHYEVIDNYVTIDNLTPETLYNYSIRFIYEGNEYNTSGTFKTLEKDEFVVTFYDEYRKERVEVTYKKGEKIKTPDLKICHEGYSTSFRDYILVFNGFDIDLATIKDDITVNVVYERKQASDIKSFSDLLKWMNEITSDDIDKVKVVYAQNIEFAVPIRREKEFTKEEQSKINEIFRKIKNEKIDEIQKEDSYSSGNINYFVYFYVDGFEYVVKIPVEFPMLDGNRMVSTSLCTYLKGLVPEE